MSNRVAKLLRVAHYPYSRSMVLGNTLNLNFRIKIKTQVTWGFLFLLGELQISLVLVFFPASPVFKKLFKEDHQNILPWCLSFYSQNKITVV